MRRFEKPILVTRPYLPPLEEFKRGLEEVWSNQWLTNNGPMLQKFQAALSRYLGVPETNLALFNNGTLALELGYKEREVVPKKIAKKASKKGVVQQDAQGRWRIINMNGPGGQPVYWKPIYKSRESAENCLRAYQSGKWNKK